MEKPVISLSCHGVVQAAVRAFMHAGNDAVGLGAQHACLHGLGAASGQASVTHQTQKLVVAPRRCHCTILPAPGEEGSTNQATLL